MSESVVDGGGSYGILFIDSERPNSIQGGFFCTSRLTSEYVCSQRGTMAPTRLSSLDAPQVGNGPSCPFAFLDKGASNMTAGIYGLYCEATGKWYVGASRNIEHRLKEHEKELRTAMTRKILPNQSHPMGEDLQIFGWESINARILEEVDTEAVLHDAEVKWMHELDSVTNGYNRHYAVRHRLWGTQEERARP